MSKRKSAQVAPVDSSTLLADSSVAPNLRSDAVNAREVDTFDPGEGWVEVPVLKMPVWSPSRSTKPLVGYLMSQIRGDAERCAFFVVRTTRETDAMVEGGVVPIAANTDVMIPVFLAVKPYEQLLSHPSGAIYEVAIYRPVRGDSPDCWQLTVRANEQGVRKSDLGL
jgi:hypothetical protein